MRRITRNYTVFAFLILILFSCKQSINETLKYIEKNKPGSQPILFAEGFVTKKDRAEFGSVFNKRGDEFFFADDTDGTAKILSTKIIDEAWIEPRVIIGDEEFSYNDPFLSPDEKSLFFISDQPRSKNDTIKDYDIWYSNRQGDDWSDPINAGKNINTDANEFYVSFNNEGTMYFASNKNGGERKHDFDIYKSPKIRNGFGKAEKLSDSINSKRYEAEGFIAPDESFLIFSSARKDGFGSGDLFISIKNEFGEWTKAENMGSIINSEHNEICPFVTYDNKFLFFSRKQDIYWMSTKFIPQLKNLSGSNK